MNDPLPENIEGSKRVAHTVNHEVNWGHVAIAVAVILLALKYGPPIRGSLLGSSSVDADEESDESDDSSW